MLNKNNLLLFVILLLGLSTSFAKTYYIKPDGNDQKSGLSDAEAWASIQKANDFAWSPGFKAGDSLLFKTGVVHSTQSQLYLEVGKTNSTKDRPLYIGAYGVGNAEIKVNTSNFLQVYIPGTVTLENSPFALEVKNLVLKGNETAIAGPKNANGISVYNSSPFNVEKLLIENCDISGFAGDGISSSRKDKNSGRFKNVLIKNVKSYNNPGAKGVAPHSGSGIVIGGADGAIIENCIAFKNGRNNNNPGGPIGIWLWDCVNSQIQYCESYDNQTIHGDGGGFDLDGACQNCIIQYCYSHNNAGAGYLLAQFSGAFNQYGAFENNTIRYNISENDGRKEGFAGVYFWGAGGKDIVEKSYVYNNTFFSGGKTENGTSACVSFLGSNVKEIKIHNNIFVSSDQQFVINSGTAFSTSQVLFQNNAYWSQPGSSFKIKWGSTTYTNLSDWQSKGQEMMKGSASGYQVNPMIGVLGTGKTLNGMEHLNLLTGYQIEQKSPLIDKGIDVYKLYNLKAAPADLWGNVIPQGDNIDIGANEFKKPSSRLGKQGMKELTGNEKGMTNYYLVDGKTFRAGFYNKMYLLKRIQSASE